MNERNNENKEIFDSEVVDNTNLNYHSSGLAQKRKMDDGDFYLLAFIIGFIAFYVIVAVFQIIGLGIMNSKYPGFANSLQVAVLNGTPLTDDMWKLQNISQFAGESFLALLMVVFLGKKLLENFKEFKKDYGKNVAFIILGFIAMLAVSMIMGIIYTKVFDIKETSENQKLINAALDSSTGIFMMLTVIFLAPFVEEVIHRFLMFGMLEKKFKLKPIFAVLISAVIFAALHLKSIDDIYFFMYFAMGLVLSGIYSISKNNLLISMGVHLLNNLYPFIYIWWL